MTDYLEIEQVLELHGALIERFGGSHGVRDSGALESALAQPRMTFGGQELYPELADKAAALGFSLIKNHPFVDGNKRIGHAAMVAFLRLNGCKLLGDIAEHERIILALAAGELRREEFTAWLNSRVIRENGG